MPQETPCVYPSREKNGTAVEGITYIDGLSCLEFELARRQRKNSAGCFCEYTMSQKYFYYTWFLLYL